MRSVETMIRKLDNRTLTKYIAAFSFGDGNLSKRGTNAFYRTAQITEHRDYIEFQAGILETLTSVNIRTYQPKDRREQTHLETRQHPMYTTAYNRMYIEGKKVIDPHHLTLLDWEYLAIIMMDDGCLVKNLNKKYNRLDCCVILCTECFSYGDNYLFAKAAKEKLNLDFDIKAITLPSGNISHRLRLNKKQTPMFLDGIRPFLAPSFEYKANLDLPNRTNSPAKTGDDIVQTA